MVTIQVKKVIDKFIYKIIETHIVYAESNGLKEVAVLWQSNERGWVRASYCTDEPCSGYKFLRGEELSMKLLLEVAGQGMNLPDDKKKKYFPGKRLWER